MDALTSLIHEDATQSMPPFDLWLTGRDDIFTWWFGPGNGCRGLARHPRRVGERCSGIRPVQAARRRRGLRAVGATGARDRERTHRRAHLLPRHRHAVPALRAAARVHRVARRPLGQNVRQAHELDELEERLRCVPQPHGAATSSSRRAGDARARRPSPHPGRRPSTSQSTTTAVLSARTAQTRSHSPGRSARRIGPRMAKATSCGPDVGIARLDGREFRKLSGRHARSATELVEPWARHTPSSSTDEIRRVGGSLPAATNRGVLACPSRNDSRHTNDCRPAALARWMRACANHTWRVVLALGRDHRRADRARRDRRRRPQGRVRDPGLGHAEGDGSHRVASSPPSRASVLNLVFAAPEGERLDTPERKAAIEEAIANAEDERVQAERRTGPGSTASATRSARTRSRTAAGSHMRRPSSTA